MELSTELITRLRETMLRYGPFENLDELRALFVDPRIKPWRYAVPGAAKAAVQVNLLIDELHEQENEQGENALGLLLRVLAEAAPEGTAGRKALTALADELMSGEAALPFSQADLRTYLERVVEQCGTLQLRGAGGPVDALPLEQVYVALKADPSNAAERRANASQLESALAELALQGMEPRDFHWAMRKLIATGDPRGLTLHFRDRAQSYLGEQVRRVDLAELVMRERWAILLGDPGCGKTTLVRWLALRFAQAMLRGNEAVTVPAREVRTGEASEGEEITLGPARLPVPLRLADYEHARWGKKGQDSALTIFEYLGRQPWLERRRLHDDAKLGQAIVQHHIEAQQALLLFDGLDEITDRTRRGQVVEAIHHFLRDYVRDPASGLCAAEPDYVPWRQGSAPPQGGNQLLLTSRVIGYYAAPLAPTLPHYTVEEMDEPAIRRFCAAWTGAIHAHTGQGTPAEDAGQLAGMLLDSSRPALREIAANPLLLTILAGLYYTLAGKLPERRIQLYEEVVRAFLRQRHEAWRARGVSADDFLYALGYVAARLHASPRHRNALADEAQVRHWLEEALKALEGRYLASQRGRARALLESARDVGGFLLERGDGVYGFIHRTFQEYFAALYLAWNPETVAVELCQRLDEPAWQVVLQLGVVQTEANDSEVLPDLLRALLDAPEPDPGLLPRNALFMAHSLPGLSAPPTEIVAEVCEQLIAAYADRSWPPNEESQRPAPLREEIEAALRFLHNLPGAAKGAGRMLTDDDPARRLAAAELILQTVWLEPALVLPLLSAARDYAEPVATIREALLHHYRKFPAAFPSELLPLRRLLAKQEQAKRLWAMPPWRAVLEVLYLDPQWEKENVPGPEAVIYDSSLTLVLLPLLESGAEINTSLLGQAEMLACAEPRSAASRDAGVLLALVDEARWKTLTERGGQTVRRRNPSMILLSWIPRARTLALDLDLDLDLDLAHSLLLALDYARDRAHARDRTSALDSALDRALGLLYGLDRALDRDLNGSRTPDYTRTRTRDYARALDLDRDRNLDSDHSLRRLEEIAGCVQEVRTHWEALGKDPGELGEVLKRVGQTLTHFRTLFAHPLYPALHVAGEVLASQRGNSETDASIRRQGRLLLNADLLLSLSHLPVQAQARLYLPHSPPEALSQQVKGMAADWLQSANSMLQQSGALLLAEFGQISEQSLPSLLRCLIEPEDLFRYRARAALERQRPASVWGRSVLEGLAAAALNDQSSYLVSTSCWWALYHVEHDEPAWMEVWAKSIKRFDEADLLLSSIHYLREDSLPDMSKSDCSLGRSCQGMEAKSCRRPLVRHGELL